MDDANEIRQLIKTESSKMLEGSANEISDKVRAYDPVTEFQKTKKNKPRFEIFVILGAVAVLCIAAVILSQVIDARTKSLTVDIKAFEDLNLRDLLDTAKRNSQDLDRAQRELQKLEADKAAELAPIETALNDALRLLRSKGLGGAELQGQEVAARDKAASDRRRVAARYDPQIEQKKVEIAIIKKRIDEYDARLKDEERRRQADLDTQQQLFDIEKKKLVAFYEGAVADLRAQIQTIMKSSEKAKRELEASLDARRKAELQEAFMLYNPVFEDPRALSLAEEGGSVKKRPAKPALPSAHFGVEEVDRLDALIDEFVFLSSVISTIPYKNSVPGGLSRFSSDALEFAAGYRKAVFTLSDALTRQTAKSEKLTGALDQSDRTRTEYASALAAFAAAARFDGLVLESGKAERIAVWIDPAAPASEGATAWIFRTDERYIGSVTLHTDGRGPYATLVELAPDETLMPMDGIMLRLQSPSAP